ncbi:hypothetical protein [Nocardia wallacei]|uniref:hypothetical protein n=1 Tax=Nocardia wallacei TaxID=480035 RepID=UPI0024588F29|nr:hypothetical protein [Nocardia wallacei]
MTEPYGEQRRPPAHESAETLISTPKSSVWQGLLGSAWVIASSIMLEVVAKLLEGAVGENEVVTRVVGAARWIVVAVVVLAAGYLVWRRVSDMRERVRRARELDLTATLVEPAAPVPMLLAPTRFRGPGQRPPLRPEDLVVAAALRELALPDFESAALYDVVSAMLAAADLLPQPRRAGAANRPTADAVIRRLMAHEVLVHCADDRFADTRRRAEPAAPHETRRTADVFRIADSPPPGAASPPGESIASLQLWQRAARQVMTPALLRHYADRVQRWVIALDSTRLGPGARRWFTDEWPRLAELVRACAPGGPPPTESAPTLPPDLRDTIDIRALAHIADALDLWFADNNWPENTDGVAAAMRLILDSPLGDRYPELRAQARIRAGDTSRRPRRYRPRRYATSLQARHAHRQALHRLEPPEPPAPTPNPDRTAPHPRKPAQPITAAQPATTPHPSPSPQPPTDTPPPTGTHQPADPPPAAGAHRSTDTQSSAGPQVSTVAQPSTVQQPMTAAQPPTEPQPPTDTQLTTGTQVPTDALQPADPQPRTGPQPRTDTQPSASAQGLTGAQSRTDAPPLSGAQGSIVAQPRADVPPLSGAQGSIDGQPRAVAPPLSGAQGSIDAPPPNDTRVSTGAPASADMQQAGDAGAAGGGRGRTRRGWLGRLWAKRAVVEMLSAGARRERGRRDGLDEVVDQLEKAWWWLPRADVAGEVCALIDLAVVHLRQGRLVAARNRLELAESLTRSGRDLAGRAHTFELMGVLWWVRGEPRRALRFWQVALTRYSELDHRLGTARCLQHLGSAMAVAPEYGSLLLDGDIDTSEVLRQASGWLAEARARHPDALFADRYRTAVCEQLRACDLAPLDRAERWPLPVADGGDAAVALA